MHYEKSLVHNFGHGDTGKGRTTTIHGKDHVPDGHGSSTKMHDSFKHGTPFRSVKPEHQHVHGAEGMSSHGSTGKSAPHTQGAAFGKSGGHAELKSDLGKNTYRPTC